MDIKKLLIEIINKLFKIGGYDYGSGSVSSINGSGDWVGLGASKTLQPGKYILSGYCSFSANSSGIRGIQWYNFSSESVISASTSVTQNTGGYMTYLNTSTLIEVGSQPATYGLRARQNSGSYLDVSSYYKIMRIA